MVKKKLTPNHQKFMEEALKEAECAFQKKEVPIGAVLVYDNEIIARGHNLVEETQDATAHAEMVCLRTASQSIRNWRLLNATLYCTLEPCSMCLGAMILSRLETLVWAAPDLRYGACGSFVSLLQVPHPIHQIQVESGIYQERAALLMQNFFRERREQSKKYLKNSFLCSEQKFSL